MSAERRADLAYVTTLAMCALVLVLSGILEYRTSQVQHSDFSYIWAGPRTILNGNDPYDAVEWQASVTKLGTEAFDDPAVYSYPPFVAIALLPIGALPLPVAADLWALGGVVAAVLSVRALLRAFAPGQPLVHGVAAGILLLCQAAVLTFYSGQWSFWLLAALSWLVVALRAQRSAAASFASLVLLIKPQFALVLLAGLAWRSWRIRERRSAALMLALPATIAVISAAALTTWWIAWIVQVPVARSREPHTTTLVAAFSDAGPLAPALAIAVILIAATITVSAGPRRVTSAALWIALALLVTPYARSYDHLLLLVPILLVCSAAGRMAGFVGVIGAAIMVPLAWLLFLVVGPIHGSESLGVMVPALVFALVAIRDRRIQPMP